MANEIYLSVSQQSWFVVGFNIRDDYVEMELTITTATRLKSDRSRWKIAVGRLLERSNPSVSS